MFKRVKVYEETAVDKELESFHNGTITKQEISAFLGESKLTLREPADNVQTILTDFCDTLASQESKVMITYLTLRYWEPSSSLINLTKYIALYCSQLKVLKLIDCGLESDHMQQISKYFDNADNCKCTLQHIDFSRNDIGSNGVINGLSSMIEYHSKTLQHLYLNCNNQTQNGLLSLSKSLCLCTNIVGVDIVGQYFQASLADDPEDEAINDASCLLSALLNKTELETLCLDCNKIVGNEEKPARDLFVEFITSCPKLCTFTLGGCELKIKDYQQLFDGFIQRGIMDFKIIQDLADIVTELTGIPQGIWWIICDYSYEYIDKIKVRLFLYGNDLNQDVYNLICDTLKNRYFAVDELDIHGNYLKYEEIAKIGNILKKFCTQRIRQITFDCGGYLDGRSLDLDWVNKLQGTTAPSYYTRGTGSRACFKRGKRTEKL